MPDSVSNMPLPYGFVKLPDVYSDGEEIIAIGELLDGAEEGHNCEMLGCADVGPHVLWRGTVTGALRNWVVVAAGTGVEIRRKYINH